MVHPEVVRAALEGVPGVAEAAVVGVDDERLGAVPVAAVERRPDAELDEATVLELAGAHLARYEVPVAVAVVDALPRTASGKADLAAVRELVAASAAARK
jgi:acyl-CoA synthetase (AMP-forming)/AMP-acid ligase II